MTAIIGTIFCGYLILATLSCAIIAAIKESGRGKRAQRLLIKTRALLEVELNDRPYVTINERVKNTL
jgi:hypothetical protein